MKTRSYPHDDPTTDRTKVIPLDRPVTTGRRRSYLIAITAVLALVAAALILLPPHAVSGDAAAGPQLADLFFFSE